MLVLLFRDIYQYTNNSRKDERDEDGSNEK
jgi:hypothetical protein